MLAPLMFLLYINDTGEHLTSHIKLFVDDYLLLRTTESVADTVDSVTDTVDSVADTVDSVADTAVLQNDLCKMSDWARKWQNPLKMDYVIEGVTFKSVSQHPYLGVEILNGKPTPITSNQKKPTQVFARSKGDSMLVRPRLEYSSAVNVKLIKWKII